MSKHYDRRQVLKGVAATGASFLFPTKIRGDRFGDSLVLTGTNAQFEPAEVELQVASVSAHTLRLTVLPIQDGQVAAVPANGSLVRTSWGEPILKLRGETQGRRVKFGNLQVIVSITPLAFAITIEKDGGDLVQHLLVG